MKIEAVPLDELSQQVAACHACSLCEGRTNTVFGEGDPHAGIMLIGEAPGRYEDLQGRPFVGAAGKLLDELLWHAHLRREEVFIANVLKCRPPSNRNPSASEIEACAPFLRTQVQTISPWLLITMGNFATQFILKTDMGTLAQADIINMNDGAERNTIYDDITVKVDAAAKSYGIHVEDVKIKKSEAKRS